MKKVTITGVSITGNRGAEAMLSTTIGRIRDKYPDVIFNVFSIYPEIDRKLINDFRIRVFSSTPFYLVFILIPSSILLSFFILLKINSIKRFFPESTKAIYDSNIMIDLSGVSFIDSRLKFVAYNVLLILPGLLLRVPVVKGAQAMGPFNKWLNRIPATLVLNRCKKIFARGKYTMRYLKDIKGLNDKLFLTTDIAFLYTANDSLSEENVDYLQSILIKLKKLKAEKKNLIIGICPSSVVYTYSKKIRWNYIDFIDNIITLLISKGHKILLFPNATREKHMKQLKNNDLSVIQIIIEKNRTNKSFLENVIFINRNLNTTGIRSLIDTLDVALISRFHAMIACLERSIPLIVIGWSHKYLEVMELFEMEELVFDYQINNANELIESMILSLIKNKSEISSTIMKKLPNVKQLSSSQMEYIYQAIMGQI